MMKTSKLVKLIAKDSYEGFRTFLITVGAVMIVALAIAFKDSWQVGGSQLYTSLSLAIGLPVIFGLVFYVIMAYVKSVQSWQNAKLVLLPATKWQFVISNLVVRLLVILINVAVVMGVYRFVIMAIEKALNAGESDNALHFSWDFDHVAESTGMIVLVFLFVNFIGLAVNLGVAHFMPRFKHAKGPVFVAAFLIVFVVISLGETYLVD
ncbi:hypothetical protein EFL45_00780 [Weissella confusa]|uniref:hypothetical protein n=1 Tax=Weissella confusa TaxID=1583 RepID=UPI00223BB4B2|nr:hypothetical protein [Weissella confusa]MCT0948005.1 hypothetical protein [Weissella confusa]